MTEEQIRLVQATVPTLQQQSKAFSELFYRNIFAAHPELLNIFNPANQASGQQPRSLAGSVLVYGANLHQPEVLGGMVERIAHKHVSLEAQAEHYPVVGKFLLDALQTILGDQATPETMQAWKAAYEQLAQIMIDVEGQMYNTAKEQGWSSFKPFQVIEKKAESSVITSFVLEPKDGQPLPSFLAGQYLSLQVKVPNYPHTQIRQYSLSQANNGKSYRISVKREPAPQDQTSAPVGLISNYLHDQVNQGDELLVHMPVGDFVLKDSSKPIVLLSGGVGITPMMSMLNTLAQQQSKRPILFVHSALNQEVHAFNAEIKALQNQLDGMQSLVFYTHPTHSPHHISEYQTGLISLATLRPYFPQEEADFYYCGPTGFTQTVKQILDTLKIPTKCQFTETFGPTAYVEVLAGVS